MRRLEDLEDNLEMDAAVQTETEFRDYQDIRADLIKEGKFWGALTILTFRDTLS